MKAIALGILFLSSIAFAETTTILLKMVSHTESAPWTRIWTVDSSGSVEFQGGNDVIRDSAKVAQLSPAALENVKAKVKRVNPAARLVDAHPEAPVCVDAPAVYMIATQDSQNIRFYSMEGCHPMHLNDGSGYELFELMSGLSTLTQ